MRADEMTRHAEQALKHHGFDLAVTRFPPDRCFDLAARGGGISIVLKAACDALEVFDEQLNELYAISDWVSATPLVLAERMSDGRLDEDAVYARGGVYALSLAALERALDGEPPLIEIRPTGCFVYIAGDAVRRRREELGISVGELAKLAGVSRMTIYSHEKGRSRTTPDVAYRLEYVLGIPIVVSINPLTHKPSPEPHPAPETATAEATGKGLLGIVVKLLSRIKLAVRALRHAPFEMMAKHDGELINVVLNIIDGDYDEERINSTKRFAELMGLDHLVVRSSSCRRPEDAVSIQVSELRSVRKPEEFAQLLT